MPIAYEIKYREIVELNYAEKGNVKIFSPDRTDEEKKKIEKNISEAMSDFVSACKNILSEDKINVSSDRSERK